VQLDGTIRAETTKDVVTDLLTYKAAGMLRVLWRQDNPVFQPELPTNSRRQ
jgi:hypothetical protein